MPCQSMLRLNKIGLRYTRSQHDKHMITENKLIHLSFAQLPPPLSISICIDKAT